MKLIRKMLTDYKIEAEEHRDSSEIGTVGMI